MNLATFMRRVKIDRCVIISAVICLLNPLPAMSVNWLILQGTEHPLAAEYKFLGLLQPACSYDTSSELSGLSDSPGVVDFSANNGRRLAMTSVSPWFEDSSECHLRRAKFGARGIFTGTLRNSFTAKMNYFALFEAAPNLMTYDPFGDRARGIALDHLSLTFNHLPGARIRAGLFKTPGAEELLQGVHTLDYIEFTDFTSRELLERFVSGAEKPAASPESPALGTATNAAYGINAARDWGIQLFDSFPGSSWDLSYAIMLGRGEAIQESHTDNNHPELYLYTSAEYDLPGGIGAAKNGVKLFGWYQTGKREFSSDPDKQEYDRIRYGFGARALGRFMKSRYKYRLGTELMFAEGMIFIAPAGGVADGAVSNGNLQIAAESGNKSRGATFDIGFYPNNKWQFDLRFHRHELLYRKAASINPGNERILRETTLGLNYHFSRKLRLTLNYVFRDVKAPTAYVSGGGFPPANASSAITDNVNTIVNNIEDRILLQLTWLL